MAFASSIIPFAATHDEKHENFTETNFKRWQQIILFHFTTLNLTRVLYEDAPMLKERETNKQVQMVVEA